MERVPVRARAARAQVVATLDEPRHGEVRQADPIPGEHSDGGDRQHEASDEPLAGRGRREAIEVHRAPRGERDADAEHEQSEQEGEGMLVVPGRAEVIRTEDVLGHHVRRVHRGAEAEYRSECGAAPGQEPRHGGERCDHDQGDGVEAEQLVVDERRDPPVDQPRHERAEHRQRGHPGGEREKRGAECSDRRRDPRMALPPRRDGGPGRTASEVAPAHP
jgi:hypothetical protein